MLQKLAKMMLKWLGWRLLGTLPDLKKYIVIVAPHTSNWDVVYCILGRYALKTKVNFLAKHQLFFFPLSLVMKAFGAIPVNRSIQGNLVDQIAERFKTEEELHLALAPEGTRKPVARWKEGFYHMAAKADVPIVSVGLDYATKSIVISQPFKVSGSIKDDFERIFAFYQNIHGKHPKIIPKEYMPKE